MSQGQKQILYDNHRKETHRHFH